MGGTGHLNHRPTPDRCGRITSWPTTFWLLVALAASSPAAADERPISFDDDIRPIFAQHCVACHGGVKQAGGLSFVYQDNVLGGGDSGQPAVVPGDLEDLALAAAVYLAAEAVSELVRARFGADRQLLTAMLLVDGVFLAYVAATTGGQTSILRSLITLQLIAVTLLVSYRTGLKMAAWHLILLFAVQHVRGDEFGDAKRTLAFGVTVLLVGAGTATFSAVNERELRRRREAQARPSSSRSRGVGPTPGGGCGARRDRGPGGRGRRGQRARIRA